MHIYNIINLAFKCFSCFFDPQKTRTFSNRKSNQLINTTAASRNAASLQSPPPEAKPEVNYNERILFPVSYEAVTK